MSTRRLAVIVACVLAGLLTLGSTPSLAAFHTTYLRQFTGASTPLGKFESLSQESVAVDRLTGDTLIAESSQGVIEVFDPLGNYSATWDGSNTPAKSFGRGEVAVAVNDASGDIYIADKADRVVDVLDSSGNYLTTLDGSNTPTKSFGGLGGVTIDQASGHIYVPDISSQAVDIFDATGAYISQLSSAATPLHSFGSIGAISVAVDDESGNVLVAASGGLPLIYVFDSSGRYIATWDGSNTPAGSFGENKAIDVSVDEATGDVLVADSLHHVIDVFDSAGAYLAPLITGAETPAGLFEELEGVAIDQATGRIYVSSQEPGAIRFVVSVFSATLLPDVTISAPTGLQSTGATLNGMVNPHGTDVHECKFEYGTDTTYGQSVPCAQSAAQIGKGSTPVPVSADLSGLQPDTLYYARLSAANENGLNVGPSTTLFTSTAPIVEDQSSSDVGSTTTSVSARIDAAGLSSTYRVEYGLSAAYGSSTPELSLGNAQSAEPVLGQLSDLRPDSEYHFRFVATNALGTTLGGDATFRTSLSATASGSSLPDGRVYEMVTPPRGEDWDVYTQQQQEPCEKGEAICSALPVQASVDGNAITFAGDPAPGGNGSTGNNLGNQFLASRAPAGGWSSNVITPTGVFLLTGIYSGFSNDLSVGTLSSRESEPLTPDAPANCTGVYSRTSSDGRFHTLLTKNGNPGEVCEAPLFAGASTDGSRIAFEMLGALTAQAPGEGARNLYESSAGQLRLVNVLPDGKPAASAVFGTPKNLLLSHVVSADGSRMFWTDLGNHNLYVREGSGTTQAKTVQIDSSVGGGGEYWTASEDGSLVFFTKAGDLYSFDVETGQTSAIASGSEVQGVIGASDDGSYVYFVAKAALRDAQGSVLRSGRGEEPVAGEENLYVSHAGTSRFLTTLAEGDSSDWIGSYGPGGLAENEAESAYRPAAVAPSGRGLVFTSRRSLTGYKNQSASEVYVYSAEADQLHCASCSPTGAPVVAQGGALSLPSGHTHLPRWINAAGTQVFFESAEPLLPQVTGGKQQVYEWEQDGAGSCHQSGGCISLLSRGTGAEAFFMDASASGSDVFLATRAQLVPQDQSDNVVLYDVRENGYRPLSQPACTGSGCQGVPPAPPIFATPSSVTFNGVGNFPPARPAVKPRAKPKRCKPGLVKKHGKCVKQKAKRRDKRSRKGSKR